MLEELNLTGVDATLCADIKLLLTHEGKQGPLSKHNTQLLFVSGNADVV